MPSVAHAGNAPVAATPIPSIDLCEMTMQPIIANFRTHARLALAVQVLGVSGWLVACSDDSPSRAPGARVTGPAAPGPSFAKGGSGGGGSQRPIAYIGPYNHLKVMQSTGAPVTELVSANAIEDAAPSWSADYQKIVFLTNRTPGSSSSVYIVNADMTGLTPVTSNLYAFTPSFSPDGSKVIFTTATLTGNPDIWVKDLGTGQMTQLTNDPQSDSYPHWSPDGTRIAFTSTRSGNSEIYLMNADGSNQTRLTYCAAQCYNAKWSPDGTRIAFQGLVFGETLFVLSLNDPQRYIPVTGARVNGADFSRSHSWSPDGKKLAFFGVRNGTAGVYSVNIDGSGTQLIGTGAREPSWSR